MRRSPSLRQISIAPRGAKLGRSLAIREVDAGSCNGCELEIHALNNAFYDLERFGLRFVASPRHADVLLVTGPVTKNMREALERTYAATPDPKWVVAVGNCAADGGIFAGSYAVVGRRVEGRARRSAHSRLPADAGSPAQGPARPHLRRLNRKTLKPIVEAVVDRVAVAGRDRHAAALWTARSPAALSGGRRPAARSTTAQESRALSSR